MQPKPLRIGLIGFGSMGRTHTWAVRNLPFFYGSLPFLATTEGVCTTTLEKSRRVAAEFGIPIAAANEDELIANPAIDIIDVCTPNNCHYATVKKALEAGKHVLCEKPITVSYPLSCEMAAEAKKQGKLLNIGVCNRYQKSVEMIEALNASGKLGNLYHVYCSFRNYRSIPGLGSAFTTKEQSGGCVLIDWGIHFLDLILYVLGGAKLKTVTCDTYNEMAKNMKDYVYKSMWAEDTKDLNGTNDVDDMVTGYIRTDKASISFNGAWAQNIGEDEMFVDFMGDKGGVRLHYGKDFEWWTVEDGTLMKKQPLYKIPDMYQKEDEAFISAIETSEHTKTHIDNILESAKLLQALYDSAEQKKELTF